MRTLVYRFNSQNENRYSLMSGMYSSGSDNRDERKRMCNILNKAMYDTLTHQQLCCLLGYINGIPQKQIAQEMHLSCSTVCRHIKAAKTKLQRIAKYYS